MVFGFRRKDLMSAAEKLSSGKWKCTNCDEWHSWPFDLAAFAPDPWTGNEAYEDNSAIRFDGNFLSEDFCILDGKYFMVRAILPIPVTGVSGEFAFGCWTTLSEENFDKYIDGFDSGEFADNGPWFGWLMNRLSNLAPGPDPLAVDVQPQPNRQRPILWVQDEEHPLAVAQANGISAKHMLAILAHYGHEPG